MTEQAAVPAAVPAVGVAADDLVDVLLRDHRTIEYLFTRLERVGWQPRHRRDLVDVTIAELTRHTAAEERYLYPAARRYLDAHRDAHRDGGPVARGQAAHREAERLMSDLMGTDVEHPEFTVLVRRLVGYVRAHIRDEESTIFVRLRAGCDPTTLAKLGAALTGTRRRAPTRPHPTISRNWFTRPVIGLFDQAADALTDRPTSIEEL